MIQTRKHSPAIDSFLLRFNKRNVCGFRKRAFTNTFSAVSFSNLKITSFMCGGEHSKSMFPIYDLYVGEICKTQRKHTSWFVRYKVLDFFFFSLKGLFMNCPVWEQFIILCACYIIRSDGYRLWKPGSYEEIIVSNPF